MNASPEFDRHLAAWLDETGAHDVPDNVVDGALAIARRLRQHRVWFRVLQRDFPMQTSLRLARGPAPAWLFLLVLSALLVAALVVVTVAGRPPAVPPPFGLVRTGLIAFDARGDVLVAAADGSGVWPLAVGPATESNPIFSPDGTHVALWREDGDALSLAIVRSDGTDPIEVALPAGLHRPVVSAQASWRPDSKQLAFAVVDPAGAEPAIWLVDASGQDLHRLTPAGTFAEDPTWSSEGTRIAYHGGGAHAPEGVYVMAADGTGAVQVSHAFGSGIAFKRSQWQPNGDLIAFSAGPDGGHDIWVVGADASGERDVSNDPRDEYWPTWSPDGSRLAFDRGIVHRSGAHANELVIVDPDGRSAREIDPLVTPGLLEDVMIVRSPAWTPDGTAVAMILGAANGDYAVAVVGLADGSMVQVPVEGAGDFVSWQRLAP